LEQDDEAAELIQGDHILTPEPNGTRAGTSLMIALGNLLAARLWLKQATEPEDEDLDRLVDSVVKNANLAITDNTSARAKRAIIRHIAVDYFEDMINIVDDNKDNDVEINPPTSIGGHEGIPVALGKLLSFSTFGITKPESPKKTKTRKPRKSPTKIEVEDTPEPEEIVETVVDEEWLEEDAESKLNADKFEKEPEELVSVEHAPWDDEEEDEDES
jgi:hypothetical protein